MGITAVDHDHQWLDVEFTDGTSSRFLGAWLRDNIGTGRHRNRGQRTFDINDVPPVSITTAVQGADGVTVSFEPEGLQETFDEQWFRQHAQLVPRHLPSLWGAEMQRRLSFEDYPTLLTDPNRLHDWLVGIRDHGFGLLENMPTTPGSILDVVDLFGYVRQTNYGRIFDVREEADPANLAFTKLKIGMHTDNPYRDPVPGLQLLHCLVNDSDGGANQLRDGFAVGEQLRTRHPHQFELLTTHPVRFRFFEEGSADLETYVPLIELDDRGRFRSIRYNSRSIQAFDMPQSIMADFYEAYRILGEALHDPAGLIEFRLEAGQLMLFDNQRVAHGRSAYDVGARHLQGCYADKDSLNSRIRVLATQPWETQQ